MFLTIGNYYNYCYKMPDRLARVAQVIVLCTERLRFNSWSGHKPAFWVGSSAGAHMEGNRSMFLSHIDVSPSLSMCSSEE